MKFLRGFMWAFALVLALGAIKLGLFLWHIRNPRVVAAAVAPDGTELHVVQTCQWDGDLFSTTVEYRRPGGPWGSFYYDHQDFYWDRGDAVVDPLAKRISVYRNGKVTATFDWETKLFRLLRSDFRDREETGT